MLDADERDPVEQTEEGAEGAEKTAEEATGHVQGEPEVDQEAEDMGREDEHAAQVERWLLPWARSQGPRRSRDQLEAWLRSPLTLVDLHHHLEGLGGRKGSGPAD